ncbi:MAG: thiopurine S-methyltransferase, partial [Planctomycetota bacterium]
MNTVPDRPDLSASAWQRRYDEQQTGWDRGEPNPALFRWLDTDDLCVGNVLVPGCGRGH